MNVTVQSLVGASYGHTTVFLATHNIKVLLDRYLNPSNWPCNYSALGWFLYSISFFKELHWVGFIIFIIFNNSPKKV